jgi:hypothetical protein
MDEQTSDKTLYRMMLVRVISALLVPFLLAAGLILFILPDRTQQFFAWTIQPPLTPLIMGAGYLSGAYFFIRAALTKEWEQVRLGFLPITAFAWLSAVTTLLHWDRFNQAHITFYAWVALYAVTPLLVPLIWWINQNNSNPRPTSAAVVPKPASLLLGMAGGMILLTGLVLFAIPQLLIPVWPWDLTPLTARVIGSWFVLPGLVDIAVALKRRWSTVRLVIESQLVGLALILIGLLRGMHDLNLANPLAWGLIAGLSLLVVVLLLVYLDGRRNAKKGEIKANQSHKAGSEPQIKGG